MAITSFTTALNAAKKAITSTVKPTTTNMVTWVSDLTTKYNTAITNTIGGLQDLQTQINDKTANVISLTTQNGITLPSNATVTINTTALTVTGETGSGSGNGNAIVVPTEVWDETNQVQFFIDTVNGVDTNNGLTQQTPLKTWDAVKALLSTKLIGYKANTYVYVKGTLQTPLDFNGIYGGSNDVQRPSLIKFYGWEDGNSNITPWTLQGVNDTGLDKRAFVNINRSFSLKLGNAVIDIPDRITFSNCNVTFNDTTWQLYNTTAPYYLGNGNDAANFFDGKYIIQGNNSFQGYRYAKLLFGDGSYSDIQGNWTFDSNSNNYAAFTFIGNAIAKFDPQNQSAPDVKRYVQTDKPAKVRYYPSNAGFNFSGNEIPVNATEYNVVEAKTYTAYLDFGTLVTGGSDVSKSAFFGLPNQRINIKRVWGNASPNYPDGYPVLEIQDNVGLLNLNYTNMTQINNIVRYADVNVVWDTSQTGVGAFMVTVKNYGNVTVSLAIEYELL